MHQPITTTKFIIYAIDETRRLRYWNEPLFIPVSTITGHLAMWAIRQISPTQVPPGLESVIKHLDRGLIPYFDCGWGTYTAKEIDGLLRSILLSFKPFTDWNDGNINIDWIDLDALFRNVCLSLIADWKQYAKN